MGWLEFEMFVEINFMYVFIIDDFFWLFSS